MANPRPNLDNLRNSGKGRPRLNHPTVAIRMAPQTRSALEFLAAQYGCVHGGEPWIGGLMAKIARGELLVVPAPPARPGGALAPRQPSSDEDRAWLESDLAGLGRYEPYDWGGVDPLSLGSAVVKGQVEGRP